MVRDGHVPIFVITHQPFSQPVRLAKHGRHAEALAVIAAVEDKPYTDADIQRTYLAIREAVVLESSLDGKKAGAQRCELVTHGRSQNFRRASLGIVVQCFQQITGINIIT